MKNRSLKYFIPFVCIVVLLHLTCMAQNVQVSAHIDSNSIRIGEQVKLHLIATYNGQKGTPKIQWPAISDSLISKVKVVSRSKIDTVKTDSTRPSLQEQKQDILITSFDSGYYAIPPFMFIVNGDTAHPQETEPIMLYVRTVAVDTTKSIKDIKAPLTASWSWLEALPRIGLGILIVAVITLIVYFVVRKLRNKKPVPIVIKEPPVDPHVKALKAMEELAAKKLWQEGKIKEYHTALTDILRTYLDDRFGINAQEMITDEIVYAMRRVDIDSELKGKLKQVLVLADLVKFAKEQPLPAEHEASFTTSIDFINSTIKLKENIPAEPLISDQPMPPQS